MAVIRAIVAFLDRQPLVWYAAAGLAIGAVIFHYVHI